MKLIGGLGAVVVTVWLQVAFFGHVRPFGVMPNLMLILIVVFGLWRHATPTLAAAIGGGLLLDMASGDQFGLRMAFYGMIALVVIAIRQLGVNTGIITGVAITTAGTLIFNLIVLTLLKASFTLTIAGIVIRELVINIIILTLLYIVRANIGPRERTALELSGRLKV